MKYYVEFDPNVNLPRSADLYYECQECGDLLPSMPKDSVDCTCCNIGIDVYAGKMAIRDKSQIKLLRI